MKNNSKEGYLKKIVPFVILFIIAMVGIIYTEYMKSLPQDYTVGTVDEIWAPASGDLKVSYYYYVNDKKHGLSVDRTGYEEIAKPGKRFIVKFPEDFHGEGVMLLDHPVPDSVEAPPAGWDEMPEF